MKKILRIVGVVIVLVVGFIVFNIVRSNSETSTPVPNVKSSVTADAGLIAYSGRSNGVSHIYIMNADGSGVTQITSGDSDDLTPEWSPDGKKLTFQRDYGVYTVNVDGSNLKRLSPTPGRDVLPGWSADGSKLVFTSVITPPTGPDEQPVTSITTMNADGSNRQTLFSNGKFNMEPRWSPDGTKIAFMCGPTHPGTDGGVEVCVMNPDGTNVTQITTDTVVYGDPHWSPDSKKIVVGSNREGGGKVNIFVMNADGTNLKQLTHFNLPYEAGDVGWSPDGQKMAFEWDKGGNGQSDPNAQAEIWIMNADGTDAGTTGQVCSGIGCGPRWQPK